MIIKWKAKGYAKEVGSVFDAPEDKAKFWISRGMAEEVKSKEAPKKKVIEEPEVKK